MRAVEVATWGQPPTFNASSTTPPTPEATSNLVQVHVLAAGLHQLVRSIAMGKHYSVNPDTTPLPFIPGSDGVGTTSDGQLVYFNSLKTGGAFAETVNLPKQALVPIPVAKDAPEETKRKLAVRIASLFNPAMSSFMALKTRVSPSTLSKPEGWTVLILGATSLSGQVASKIARQLGAKTIIGVARNTAALQSNKNIDIAVKLEAPASATDYASVLAQHKVDVILDYLYGDPVLALFAALPSDAMTAHANSTEYVQIGSVAAMADGGSGDISFPSAFLRGKNLTMRGAGPGSWSVTKDAGDWFPELLRRLAEGDEDFDLSLFPVVVERKFEQFDEAWADTKSRSVFVT